MNIINLLDILNPEVNWDKEHIRRLKIIDNQNYSGVCMKVAEWRKALGKETTQEYLAEGILALKQYYALPVIDPLNAHAVSKDVDPFWHAHILHTKDYSKFCNDVVGSFMHHDPLDHENEQKVENVSRLYAYTSGIYKKMFIYKNKHLIPDAVKKDELICMHFGNSYPALSKIAIFPMLENMQ